MSLTGSKKKKKMWYKDFVIDDEIVELYGGYKKRKAKISKKKRKVNAHCLDSITLVGLVCP